MAKPDYFKILLNVVRRPAMYGIQDAMDLSVFLTGYSIGASASELDRVLQDLTVFLKKENPEWRDSTCGWSHIIKSQSWERGGSIKLFKMWLGRMLLEQGHWRDAHYEVFTSEKEVTEMTWTSLPSPPYSEVTSE